MSKKIKPILQVSDPRASYPWALADVVAVKALANGGADESQQKRLFDLILAVSGMKEQTNYRLQADSDFAGGKRFVGLQFAWAFNMNTEEFKIKTTKEKK